MTAQQEAEPYLTFCHPRLTICLRGELTTNKQGTVSFGYDEITDFDFQHYHHCALVGPFRICYSLYQFPWNTSYFRRRVISMIFYNICRKICVLFGFHSKKSFIFTSSRISTFCIYLQSNFSSISAQCKSHRWFFQSRKSTIFYKFWGDLTFLCLSSMSVFLFKNGLSMAVI